MITLTYKLNDYMACLSYIDLALSNKPNFAKGHDLRKRIYGEYPFLDPDPERKDSKPTYFRPVEENPELVKNYRDRIAEPPQVLTCDSLSYAGLASVLHRYIINELKLLFCDFRLNGYYSVLLRTYVDWCADPVRGENKVTDYVHLEYQPPPPPVVGPESDSGQEIEVVATSKEEGTN